jgi:hypothetical protein
MFCVPEFACDLPLINTILKEDDGQLRYYEYFLTRDAGCFDPSTDSRFILIHRSAINVAISNLKCVLDCFLNCSLVHRLGKLVVGKYNDKKNLTEGNPRMFRSQLLVFRSLKITSPSFCC